MKTILTRLETPLTLIDGSHGVLKIEAVSAWADKIHRNTRLPILSAYDLEFNAYEQARRYGYATDLEIRGTNLVGEVTWNKGINPKFKGCEIRICTKRKNLDESKNILSFTSDSFILLDSTIRTA